MANHRTCQLSPFPTSCAPFKFHDEINFVTLQQRWSCLIYESARKKWNKCCQKLPYHKCTETPSLISHSSLSLSHSFFLYRTHTVSLSLSLFPAAAANWALTNATMGSASIDPSPTRSAVCFATSARSRTESPTSSSGTQPKGRRCGRVQEARQHAQQCQATENYTKNNNKLC